MRSLDFYTWLSSRWCMRSITGLQRYLAMGPTGRGMAPEELRPLLDSGHKLLEQAAKSVPSELNLVVKQSVRAGERGARDHQHRADGGG